MKNTLSKMRDIIKNTLHKILRVILCFLGVILILAGTGGIITVFHEKNLFAIIFCIMFATLFIVGGCLLLNTALRKMHPIVIDKNTTSQNSANQPITEDNTTVPNNKTIAENLQHTEQEPMQKRGDLLKITIKHSPTPTETLQGMGRAYAPLQLENDARIMNESFNLMQSTNNLDTFFSRYELAMQKCLTLLQAQQAGFPLGMEEDFDDDLISAKNTIMPNLLRKSYEKELQEINRLKTVNGKLNRIEKYIELLFKYEDEFEFIDEFHNILRELDDLKVGLSLPTST